MTDAVVITAVGLRCAGGRDLAQLGARLREHQPCVTVPGTALPVPAWAAVPGHIPELPEAPDDRKTWLLMAALEDALQDGVFDDSASARVAPDRRALFLGTGLSSVTAAELEEDVYPHLHDGILDSDAVAADLARDRAAPRRHLPGRATALAARRANIQGPTGTSFSACAAAAQAMAEGLRALRRGDADVALVGGHDSMLHPLGLLSFVVLGALAPDRCRPFDRAREGFLIGEGAAVFVLERESSARGRGATILGRLLGAGTSADAWNVTAPQPEGLGAERAMRRALRDAGIGPADIDYVNAHGTGTPVGDLAEAQAIHRVLGDKVPVSSTKGAFGHTIAAAGAIEAAVCLAALQQGFLPGTCGLQERDPACPIDALVEPRQARPRRVLSNSFGFGGQNACLVFGAADQENARV